MSIKIYFRNLANAVLGYDMGKPSRLTATRSNYGKRPNELIQRYGVNILEQARELDQNYDVAQAILRTLVLKSIGESGIGIEPLPTNKDGTVNTEYAKALHRAFKRWAHRPEVRRTLSFAQCQRLVALSKYRDGEAFTQLLPGRISGLKHRSDVPLSFQLIDALAVPAGFVGNGYRNGIKFDKWGAPLSYAVVKEDLSKDILGVGFTEDYDYVTSDRMLHIYNVSYIGQVRGVSLLASSWRRLADTKLLDEYERISSAIAAALTAYVKRTGDSAHGVDYSNLERDENGIIKPRELFMQAGMIIDSLEPGEEIGLIDSKTDKSHLVAYRKGQIQLLSSGAGVGASIITGDYDGSFSSRRQESIETDVNYKAHSHDFISGWLQPIWTEFCRMAHISGVAPIPDSLDIDTFDDAAFTTPRLLTIDPLKEANAMVKMLEAGLASHTDYIRQLGKNPDELLRAIADFRQRAKDLDLDFASIFRRDVNVGTAKPAVPDAPDDGADVED